MLGLLVFLMLGAGMAIGYAIGYGADKRSAARLVKEFEDMDKAAKERQTAAVIDKSTGGTSFFK